MMRSLFSGVSGLKNHQVRMDVIGNNVANVNTMAFKAGRVTFKEGFAQLLQGASRANEGQGGVNPRQVGLGVQVGSIDTIFTQGNVETTGVATDLSIQGDGFFVVARGNERFYTRAGNFQLDAEGRLISANNGFRVQGLSAENGELSRTIGDIRLPLGQQTAAAATGQVTIGGNLDASAPDGTAVDTSITVFDSQGRKHELTVTFTKGADNTWDWAVDAAALDLTPGDITGGTGTVTFGPTGTMDPIPNPVIEFTPVGGAEPMSITLDLGAGTVNGLTQFAGSSTTMAREQDGYTAGTLLNFTIDRSGLITGAFSNGNSMVLGQVAVADFNNPSGLQRMGDNLYTTSANSGDAAVGFATGSRNVIMSGALEMSNVDLTQEFTNMIVAQRGFQANGRVITSTDEMLQEVVNLKR